MIKHIVLVCLLMVSLSAYADTYPAHHTYTFSYNGSFYSSLVSASDVCSKGPVILGTPTQFVPPLQCAVYSQYGYNYQTIFDNSSCPYGGSVSGLDCVAAPSCPAGQYRDSTGACITPPTCLYPETWDAISLACHVPECPASQIFNYLILGCDVPPSCATTERLNPATFACELSPLQCPGHSHASSGNDRCLADPALTCPIGQHDDGAYNCVANDAPAPCNANQRKGYIDGFPQCIAKPHLDTAQKAAADAAAAKSSSATAKAAAAAAAKAASDAAAASSAAAAADPTNTDKATQAATDAAAKTAADTASSVASAADDAAKIASDKADNDAKNQYLKSIADDTQAAEDRANARKGGASSVCSSPPTCVGDAIDCAVLQQTWANSCRGLDATGAGDARVADSLVPVSKSVSTLDSTVVVGSCPAAQTFVVQGQTMSISYQFICDYATAINFLVLAVAWLGAGFIVFGNIRS